MDSQENSLLQAALHLGRGSVFDIQEPRNDTRDSYCDFKTRLLAGRVRFRHPALG